MTPTFDALEFGATGAKTENHRIFYEGTRGQRERGARLRARASPRRRPHRYRTAGREMLGNKVCLSVYEQGEIMAQPELSWKQAVDLATEILVHALAVKRHQGEKQWR